MLFSVNFVRHFWFSLSLYHEMKMLYSLSHILVIWVFHIFSLVLVDKNSLDFSQLLVKMQLPTFILVDILYVVLKKHPINYSLFRPNQLSLWEIWIKDWIRKNWNKCSFCLVEIQIQQISDTVGLLNKYTFIKKKKCLVFNWNTVSLRRKVSM